MYVNMSHVPQWGKFCDFIAEIATLGMSFQKANTLTEWYHFFSLHSCCDRLVTYQKESKKLWKWQLKRSANFLDFVLIPELIVECDPHWLRGFCLVWSVISQFQLICLLSHFFSLAAAHPRWHLGSRTRLWLQQTIHIKTSLAFRVNSRNTRPSKLSSCLTLPFWDSWIG